MDIENNPIYVEARKKKCNEYHRKYRLEHKEKIREWNRKRLQKWKAERPEEYKAKLKERNKSAYAYQKQYRQDRKEKYQQYSREYYRKNREKIRQQQRLDKERSRLRHQKRKLELIKQKGGKCEKCGYNRNVSVLGFHHPNGRLQPLKKDRSNLLSEENPQSRKFDLSKVVLLCSNCHLEIHHPDLNIEILIQKIAEAFK